MTFIYASGLNDQERKLLQVCLTLCRYRRIRKAVEFKFFTQQRPTFLHAQTFPPYPRKKSDRPTADRRSRKKEHPK